MKPRVHSALMTLLFTGVIQGGLAQNLVPNSSFEDYSECPESGNQGEPLQCTPWTQGNAGTADYFHACSTPDEVGVPINWLGNQSPVSGVAYVGVLARNAIEQGREYVQAQLDIALSPGVAYLVSFYVSPVEGGCATRPMGALLSSNPPAYNEHYVLQYTPQIEIYGEFIDNYSQWTTVSRCFIAEGGENYITIGNFREDAETPIAPGCLGEC